MNSAPRHRQPYRPETSQATNNGVVVGVILTIALVIGVVMVVGAVRDGGGTTVPPPTAGERNDTVPILARAADQHGLCYGWKLTDRSDPVSVGSNLGVDVGVEDSDRCPRWVQVEARVTYTSASSEANDFAAVTVTTSPDLDRSRLVGLGTRLERFGLTDEVFVDDPGWAVTRAATILPLLVAEAGVAEPLATPAPVPAAQVSALPEAGSDLWRDRWGALLTAAGLLLAAVALCTVGLVQRSRQRRTPVTPTPSPGPNLVIPPARRRRKR